MKPCAPENNVLSHIESRVSKRFFRHAAANFSAPEKFRSLMIGRERRPFLSPFRSYFLSAAIFFPQLFSFRRTHSELTDSLISPLFYRNRGLILSSHAPVFFQLLFKFLRQRAGQLHRLPRPGMDKFQSHGVQALPLQAGYRLSISIHRIP